MVSDQQGPKVTGRVPYTSEYSDIAFTEIRIFVDRSYGPSYIRLAYIHIFGYRIPGSVYITDICVDFVVTLVVYIFGPLVSGGYTPSSITLHHMAMDVNKRMSDEEIRYPD